MTDWKEIGRQHERVDQLEEENAILKKALKTLAWSTDGPDGWTCNGCGLCDEWWRQIDHKPNCPIAAAEKLMKGSPCHDED